MTQHLENSAVSYHGERTSFLYNGLRYQTVKGRTFFPQLLGRGPTGGWKRAIIWEQPGRMGDTPRSPKMLCLAQLHDHAPTFESSSEHTSECLDNQYWCSCSGLRRDSIR